MRLKLFFFLFSYALIYSYEKKKLNVFYMSPFLSGGGYGSESIDIAFSLFENEDYLNDKNYSLNLQLVHHGDEVKKSFVESLEGERLQNMRKMFEDKHMIKEYNNKNILGPVVILCHSEPGSLDPPLFNTLECPINFKRFGFKNDYMRKGNGYIKISRTMFETDRIPNGWVPRLNKVDEIWVPSKFHVNTFEKSGIERDKIHVLGEPVDTKFFSPEGKKIELDFIKNNDLLTINLTKKEEIFEEDFKFISVFKLEERKGWKILLQSYFEEFSRSDKVNLILLVNGYHLEKNKTVVEIMNDFVKENFKEKISKGDLARWFILSDLDLNFMPNFYRMGNVFVLPTRGEGWGRPFSEAMSCGIPVIGTNYSGQTEFLNSENSYLLNIEGLVSVKGHVPDGWSDHNWANPSLDHLKLLLRHCFSHQNNEVKKKGENARKTMLQNYSRREMSKIFYDNLIRIVENYNFDQKIIGESNKNNDL